jgi:hypothetical protein
MKELKNIETLNNKKLLATIAIKQFEEQALNDCLYSLANQSSPVDVLILVSEKAEEGSLKRIEEIASAPYKLAVKEDEEGNPKTEVIQSEKKLNFAIETTSANNFSSVYNEAFNKALENGYEWISFVEKDDLVEENWIKNLQRYSEEMEDVSIVFPVIRQTNAGNMVGHLNEATWLEGRAEVAGHADLQLLMSWNCLAPTGCMLKLEEIKEYSEEREDGKYYPFKENMNVAASYEFFLRMIYEDVKTYTVPRYGYLMRMDSQIVKFDEYSSKIPANITQLPKEEGGMTSHEVGFWMEQAKSEYFMPEDREITYEAPSEVPAV